MTKVISEVQAVKRPDTGTLGLGLALESSVTKRVFKQHRNEQRTLMRKEKFQE